MLYAILHTSSSAKLEAQVNTYLKDGWALQGGASVAIDQGQYKYIQAMVKQTS